MYSLSAASSGLGGRISTGRLVQSGRAIYILSAILCSSPLDLARQLGKM